MEMGATIIKMDKGSSEADYVDLCFDVRDDFRDK